MMEVTMGALMQFLSESHRIVKTGDFSEDFPVQQVCILTETPKTDTAVYLNLQPVPLSCPNVLNILTDGSIPEQPGWYLLCSQEKLWDAVNDCFALWQRFGSWREKCRELALMDHDLPGLLEAGAQCLNIDIAIIDREYRYDGGAQPQNARTDAFFSGSRDMSLRDVEELYLSDPRFDETFHTVGLVYYPPSPAENARIYYYNLRYDRLYLGRLLYKIPDTADSPALRRLAEGFGALVEKCYQFHYLRKNKGMPRHSVFDLWKQLLEGGSADREETEKKLRAMGWEASDRYRILYLLSNGYIRSSETLKFYAVQLEQTFPACIAVQMEDGIFLLHDLDREKNPDFRQQLGEFLRENLFLSGISNVFSDFHDSRRYSLQAKDALYLGSRASPSLWRHEFRDYQSDYIYQQCLSRYTARDLCPGPLEKLLAFDAENPEVELARTLETYYRCKFNAAEAAKRLYIHRTTFFYRLNKIRQISAIDFDDPQQQLQILLYFALAREEQRRQSAHGVLAGK